MEALGLLLSLKFLLEKNGDGSCFVVMRHAQEKVSAHWGRRIGRNTDEEAMFTIDTLVCS